MGTYERARRGRRAQVFAKRERAVAALAAQQHGAVSQQQLLAAGFGSRTIRRWTERGRLHRLHRGVFAFGREDLSQHGQWMAAVLAGGDGALLSHRSAASLWGLMRHRLPIDVTVSRSKRRVGIAFHECGVRQDERTVVEGVPVTNPARTLLDLAELADERALAHAVEEAERLRLLELPVLELVLARGFGRRGLKPLRTLLDASRGPATRSPLEDRVRDLCRTHGLPEPMTNVVVLGKEVDAFWPDKRLMVEADSFEFHGHRAAFERDRARDAVMQAAGYRVIRLTHRRLEDEPEKVVSQLRQLLSE